MFREASDASLLAPPSRLCGKTAIFIRALALWIAFASVAAEVAIFCLAIGRRVVVVIVQVDGGYVETQPPGKAGNLGVQC